MRIVRKILSKVKALNIHIDAHGILTVKRSIPFLTRIFLQKDKDKIYLIQTKASYVLNILTVKNPFLYTFYGEFKFFFFTFNMPFFINLEKLLSSNGKYVAHSKIPIKKGLVIFESFFGKSYAGQPKYIYEYLLKLDLPYTYVWVYDEDKHDIKGNPIVVERGSIDYFKYAAKAEYLVNNIVFPFHSKREESTYLQTWHGTPLKKLGYDIVVDGPEVRAREKFYKESRGWDYLITQNRYTSNVLKKAFKYEGEIIESGYPHSSILLENDIDKVNQIKSKLNIAKDTKVILYAPTWRDNDSNGNWSFNFELQIDLKRWQQTLGDEYVILIRMHHLISSIKNLEEVKGFAINVSKYDDIQELSLISDILITDYSSVFFDFAVTKKPILFYTYDLEKYTTELRGFYLDMKKDMPGPLCMNGDELLESIKDIETIEKKYHERYNKFIDTFCYLDTEMSTKIVVEKVFKEINE